MKINTEFEFLVIVASHVSSTTITNHWNYSWREAFLCAICLCISSPLRYFRPKLMISSPGLTTASFTHIHRYTWTHSCSHRPLIFNGIIYILTDPPPLVYEHVRAVTYCCCLLGIHVERVIRKSDRSSFMHRGAHKWSRHTLLNTNNVS